MSHSASSRWFCHACETYFPQPVIPHDPQCLNCHSSFVEELSSSHSNSPINPYSSHFIDSLHDSDSPPIPSTRQRYEQQQNPHLHPPTNRQPFHPAPFINLIDPLINILSAPPIPNPPDRDDAPSSSHPSPPPRSAPHALSSIGDFLTQHYSPQAFTRSIPSSNRSAQSHEDTSNNNHESSPDHSASPPLPAQGVYTFTFGSRNSNHNLNDTDASQHRPADQRPSAEPSRPSAGERAPTEDRFSFDTPPIPPPQPLNGILSLLQSAFGLTPSNSAPPENERRTTEGRTYSNPRTERTTSNEQPTSPSPSTEGRVDDHPPGDRSGENSHRTQPRPTPRSPRVNIEESHPLRQFINILNSLNQSDASISRNGVNGFVINGGAGFGFATQFDMDQNSPFSQNLGDYVTSDSAMQDILNQLINMTGATGGHNPTPASESTIKSLRKFKFDPTSVGQEDPIECAICKDTFAVGDSCMELPCKHFFHDEDCIVLWLKQNGSCPVCRYSLVDNQTTNDSHSQDTPSGDRNTQETSASADDSQYRPDAAEWLDPDGWYDEPHLEAPFDYD